MKTGKVSLALGLTSAVIFVVCFVWDLILPTLAMLPTKFLPWVNLTFAGFVLGIVETFIYALGIGALFAWIYNRIAKE